MTTHTQTNTNGGDGNAAHYLDGTGNYSTPSGSTGPYSNVVKSSSSGVFNVTATSFTAVTNLSCTITTLGGPVFMQLNGNSGTNSGIFSAGAATGFLEIGYFRGATQLSIDTVYTPSNGLWIPGSSASYIDTPAAGTYTYTFQAYLGGSGGSATIQNCIMTVMEI